MLYVVRHGETEWNRVGRFQGQLDSPLSELGQRQARAVAALLADKSIARIFASPLGRAWTTASHVSAATGVEVVADERLKEVAYGRCEGLIQAEIEENFPGMPAWREQDKWTRAYPEAECYRDLFDRAGDFARELIPGLPNPEEAPVCIVGHNALNRALVGVLSGWSPQQIMTQNQANNAVYCLDGREVRLVEADLG